MADSILKVENLSVDLNLGAASRKIIKNVSFGLQEREVLGIIGESGSGKTVLSRALIRAVPPPLIISGGRILFRGTDILALNEKDAEKIRGRKIAIIGANPFSALDPTITVGNQLVEKVLATTECVSKQDAKERVLKLLGLVRIPDPSIRFNEFPYQYSGGMIQRVMIVDALLNDPDLIIADNVTLPLDVTIAAQIISIFKELRERVRAAFVFISSSLPVVCEIANRISVLVDGRIVETANPEELVKNPKTNYTQTLIGHIPKIWERSPQTETEAKRRARRKAVNGDKAIISMAGVAKTYRTKIRNSFFKYNEVQAVRNATFDVFKGESFGLVGESGCGKSTLSRLLTWLENVDSGKIEFLGRDVSALGRRERFRLRSRFQLLLQDPYNSIPGHWPIGRTIMEPLLIHTRLSKKEARVKVAASMQEVGLSPILFWDLPGGLSAGQRQRVNIARGLVLNPEMMILDETLTSLDHSEQDALLQIFEKLQETHQLTYIIISHDLSMVRRACDRIGVMYLGEIVELGDNEQIFENATHPYTHALLSALPTLEEKPYVKEDCLLDGEPPSPINLPRGCSFANRCPYAFDKCREHNPKLTKLKGGGMRACHLPVSELTQRGSLNS